MRTSSTPWTFNYGMLLCIMSSMMARHHRGPRRGIEEKHKVSFLHWLLRPRAILCRQARFLSTCGVRRGALPVVPSSPPPLGSFVRGGAWLACCHTPLKHRIPTLAAQGNKDGVCNTFELEGKKKDDDFLGRIHHPLLSHWMHNQLRVEFLRTNDAPDSLIRHFTLPPSHPPKATWWC